MALFGSKKNKGQWEEEAQQLGTRIISVLDDPRIQPASAKIGVALKLVDESPLAADPSGSDRQRAFAAVLFERFWRIIENAKRGGGQTEAAMVSALYKVLIGVILSKGKQDGVEVDIGKDLSDKGHRKFHAEMERGARETLRRTGG